MTRAMKTNIAMASTPIDVWNLESFDAALVAALNEHRELLLDYEVTSKKNFIEQRSADGWVQLRITRMPTTAITSWKKSSRPPCFNGQSVHGTTPD
jgi:hypothetical protein